MFSSSTEKIAFLTVEDHTLRLDQVAFIMPWASVQRGDEPPVKVMHAKVWLLSGDSVVFPTSPAALREAIYHAYDTHPETVDA